MACFLGLHGPVPSRFPACLHLLDTIHPSPRSLPPMKPKHKASDSEILFSTRQYVNILCKTLSMYSKECEDLLNMILEFAVLHRCWEESTNKYVKWHEKSTAVLGVQSTRLPLLLTLFSKAVFPAVHLWKATVFIKRAGPCGTTRGSLRPGETRSPSWPCWLHTQHSGATSPPAGALSSHALDAYFLVNMGRYFKNLGAFFYFRIWFSSLRSTEEDMELELLCQYLFQFEE